VTVGFRWENRDFADEPDERLAALLLRFDRKLTGRFSVSLEGNIRRSVSQDDPDPTLSVLVRPGLTYEFGPSLFGYGAYVRTQSFSDNPENEYSENAVIFGVRLAF
jgi:hypothetical protein